MQTAVWHALMDQEMALLDAQVRARAGAAAVWLELDGVSRAPSFRRADVSLRLQPSGRLSGDVTARADAWPLASRSVETVVLRHAVAAIADPTPLLGEAARVLVPGGHLIVVGLHPCSPWHAWMCWQARGADSRYHVRSPWRLQRRLVQAGLRLEGRRRYGSAWPADRVVTAGNGALAACYLLRATKQRGNIAAIRLRPQRVTARVMHGSLPDGARRQSLR